MFGSPCGYRLGMTVLLALAMLAWPGGARAEPAPTEPFNLALVATPTTSFVSGHETLTAINNGYEPRNIDDHSHGAYGNWPETGTQWVQYEWSKPVTTRTVAVYWWQDGRGIHLPTASRLLYWNGTALVPVPQAVGLGVKGGAYQETTFPEITTTRLRLEFDGHGKSSTGIIQWKVLNSGQVPSFPPQVKAGADRVVVLPCTIDVCGEARGAITATTWSKAEGPGTVTFENPAAAQTVASFAAPGQYVLQFAATSADQTAADTLHVTVTAPPPPGHLDPVYTTPYSISSPLWRDRTKQLIVHWIPHLIAKLSDPKVPEGGLNNFVQAGNKLAGRPYQPHFSAPWSNAYTHNTLESMCLALVVDAQGDQEMLAAQQAIKAKIEEWIPIILAAQEPDGYLQTRFTLGFANEQGRKLPGRWTIKGDHEGYTAGYFIDAAIAHFVGTNGQDHRLYDAAKRLADCWDNNIGPAPKKKWYDGHEELEQALVRLGRLVNTVEGPGKGAKYITLARFLLDCRGGGDEYDQSHAPVVRQYEAVGHAVRASYLYSAMADVAMETGDAGYYSAIQSIWNNLVHRKYYVTGGIGSGETSEGFGKDYSLPNNAYCESCSGCGEIFFQHKMNLAFRSAQYADLFEETLYNAVLSDVDLEAYNFTYTNALDTSEKRYPWHGCPCCVGNIPRTLLMLPTWLYATSNEGLYVNLFLGSTVNVENVAGTKVQVVQSTNYPWDGKVSITLNPAAPKNFTLFVRVPDRGVSQLYKSNPDANGIKSLAVNGQTIQPTIEKGYALISREWKAGDKVELELPMVVQRVHASDKIVADRGRVALRYGPLVYVVESADQKVDGLLAPDSALTTEWQPDLLHGVTVIRGTFADGSKMQAVPYYVRNNRGGRAVVWIKEP